MPARLDSNGLIEDAPDSWWWLISRISGDKPRRTSEAPQSARARLRPFERLLSRDLLAVNERRLLGRERTIRPFTLRAFAQAADGLEEMRRFCQNYDYDHLSMAGNLFRIAVDLSRQAQRLAR